MDRGDNLAGIGSLNGISMRGQNPMTLAGPADLADFHEFLDTVFDAQ